MAQLTPAIALEIVAACQAGAVEAAQVLSRTFDLSLELAVGEPSSYEPGSPDEPKGSGLVIILQVESAAALLLIPESSGLLPAWYVDPDPTGQSKLSTLAQELGMLLMPEAYAPSEFKAGHVQTLSGALKRAGVATGAGKVPLTLSDASGKQGVAHLIWPAATPSAIFQQAAPATKKPAAPTPVSPPQPRTISLEDLPGFTRSLLKIKVPVMVTLAAKKQPLGQIIELGPGSIIQFDKSCEEMLDMEAAGHRVAQGEAVKVGGKFGLRITSVVLPEERFEAVTLRK
jgi:flagellar motor switch protein FliN